MNEPERLKDKYAGQLEGAVLGSARVDVPSARARGRTLVGLGFAATATGLPVTTTAAAGAKTFASIGMAVAVKWGGIGIAVGALTLGGVREAPRWFAPRTQASASTAPGRKGPALAGRSSESAPRVEPDTLPNASGNDVALEETPRDLETAPVRKGIVAPVKDTRVEPSVARTRLAEEVSALDQARQALKTNPERALALVDDYLRRFPSGELYPEATVLQIDAFIRNDRRSAAEVVAREYLSRNPRSPHAKRVRALMGWSDETR